jgi:hypothetical protein
MSSAVVEEDDTMMCCASCGIKEVDDIKLKKCNACGSVRYCGDKCQNEHRPQHKRACQKRVAELRDEILFRQPESSHWGDCPICCLPLSIDPIKSTMTPCCSKVICVGCNYANQVREIRGSLERRCPFCRHPAPKTDEESDIHLMKRAEANDVGALREVGIKRYEEGDYKSAFAYVSKAAELADAVSHYCLSVMYDVGHGVEKDEKKRLHHLEEAAIGGHPFTRHNLGCVENENGRTVRAVKHWIIAANLGHDESLDVLKQGYKAGVVSKLDYAAALRAHQAAVDATKSPQRDEAEAFRQREKI